MQVMAFNSHAACASFFTVRRPGRLATRRSAADRLEAAQAGAYSGTVEDIVSQNQCHRVGADVVGPDDERLRQAIGAGLLGIAYIEAELDARAEQALVIVEVLRRGDDQQDRGPKAGGRNGG